MCMHVCVCECEEERERERVGMKGEMGWGIQGIGGWEVQAGYQEEQGWSQEELGSP